MDFLKKAARAIVPKAEQSSDGRDTWPSRTAFILASASGCAGMGNLLRYPSTLYNNAGLQWFIPYLIAIFLIAIPVLVLEIAVGQAYRGGSVVAYNNVNNRLKGMALAVLYVAFVVGPYFVVNLAWIMAYFADSFKWPLPWDGRVNEYFFQDVVANVDPVDNGGRFLEYPGVAMIGETTGWTAFTWMLVFISIFQGPSITGRVVYFTMGLPVCVTLILVGRSLSLPNAEEGVKLVWASWDSDALASGTLWQTACGQVFFSIGIGFGYFTAYASYNQKFSNAVMDSIIIALTNALFENVAAFAVLGCVGYLELWPKDHAPLGAFDIGFLTLPQAVAEMPGANFWAFCLFFTLMLLGYSSAFAMLDACITMLVDAGVKVPGGRPGLAAGMVVLSFLLSLPYCTEFGYYLLSGVDMWINNVALVFVVWAECAMSTTLYRWQDVWGQVGKIPFYIYTSTYFLSQILGVAVGQSVSPQAGAGVGFGIWIVGNIIAVVMAKTPDDETMPAWWRRHPMLTRFCYMSFYSGNMLRRDLNQIVGLGKNWNIPSWWAPLIRFISAPILAIVYSFSYSSFYPLRNDPLHIFGIAVAHIALLFFLTGLIMPRWYDIMIPRSRRGEGKRGYAPGVLDEISLEGTGMEAPDAESAVVQESPSSGSDQDGKSEDDKKVADVGQN